MDQIYDEQISLSITVDPQELKGVENVLEMRSILGIINKTLME